MKDKEVMVLKASAAEELLDRMDFVQNKMLPKIDEIASIVKTIESLKDDLLKIKEDVNLIHQQSVNSIKNARTINEYYKKNMEDMRAFFKEMGNSQIKILERQENALQKYEANIESVQDKQIRLIEQNNDKVIFFYDKSLDMVKNVADELYKSVRKYNEDFSKKIAEDFKNIINKEMNVINTTQLEALKSFTEVEKEIKNIGDTNRESIKKYGRYIKRIKIFNLKNIGTSFLLGLLIGAIGIVAYFVITKKI